jgi:general secretion pathway protein E
MARAWAALLEVPLLALDTAADLIDPLPALTERFLRHFQVVPLAWREDGLHVASANPADAYAFEAIAYCCQVPVWLSIGTRNDVDTLIERYYGQGRSAIGTLIESLDDHNGSPEDIEHLKDLASEAPVIRLVNLILQRAVEQRASDIHIEPFESQLKVRYRIDGVLHEAVQFLGCSHFPAQNHGASGHRRTAFATGRPHHAAHSGQGTRPAGQHRAHQLR